MAIEDNLDQLYAETMANRILVAQLYGFFSIASKEPGWMDRQMKMALQSVDMWSIDGHRDPEKMKQMAREAIISALTRLHIRRSEGDQLQ